MNPYSKKEKTAYLLGVAGQNILYTLVATVLPYFLQSVIFLPAMAVGMILTIGKLLDALKDPFMGILLDRTKSKWGKCRPYLLFSPLPIALFTVLIFCNQIYSSENTTMHNIGIIVWTACMYLLWSIAFSCADSPLWSLPLRMTVQKAEQDILLTRAKVVSAVSGGLISAAALPALQTFGIYLAEKLHNNVRGLQYGSILTVMPCAVIGAALLQYTAVQVKERVTTTAVTGSVRQSLKSVLTYRPYRQLLLSGLLRSPISVLNTVTTTFIVYYFGNNGNTPYIQYLLLLGGGYMLGQLGGMLFTPRLTNQYAKNTLYSVSNLCGAAPFILIFLMYCAAPSSLDSPLSLTVLTILMTACGIGQGLVSALQTVMTADCSKNFTAAYHQNAEGTFFSGLSLLNKASAGIGSLLTAVVYTVVGFEGETLKAVNNALYMGAEFKSDPQFFRFRAALLILLCIPPAISGILAILPMQRYSNQPTQ